MSIMGSIISCESAQQTVLLSFSLNSPSTSNIYPVMWYELFNDLDFSDACSLIDAGTTFLSTFDLTKAN